jgi:hypothetical protein
VLGTEREVNTLDMARKLIETLEPVASGIASLFKAKLFSGEAVGNKLT